MLKYFTAPLVFISFLCCGSLNIEKESTNNFIPGEADAPGWKFKDRPVYYDSGNIANSLKGKLSLYRKYGILDMATAGFQALGDSKKVIDIKIYRMNSSLNAFGILSRERGFTDSDHISGYPDSYTLPDGFFFRHDEYYIVINVSSIYNDVIKDLQYFARIIENGMQPVEKTLPEYCALFGRKDFRNDMIYYPDGFADIPVLKEIFMRKKLVNNVSRSIIFTKRDSRAAAMRDYNLVINYKGSPFILSNSNACQVSFRKKTNEEYIYLAGYREWIFGITDAATMAEGAAAIDMLEKELLNSQFGKLYPGENK